MRLILIVSQSLKIDYAFSYQQVMCITYGFWTSLIARLLVN